jgi:hypothetical protein
LQLEEKGGLDQRRSSNSNNILKKISMVNLATADKKREQDVNFIELFHYETTLNGR